GGVVTVVVFRWRGGSGGGSTVVAAGRVRESGIDERIDQETSNLFGFAGKIPPEKLSGGGVVAAASGGCRPAVAAAGGGEWGGRPAGGCRRAVPAGMTVPTSRVVHAGRAVPADYKALSFDDDHIKEISSGSTTTHSDISLSEYDSFIFDFAHEVFVDELAHIISPPEYDCFYSKDFPDPGDLMSVLNFEIRENLLSTTRVNLPIEDDHSPLLAYVVWIFVDYLTYPVIPPYLQPFGNEDTIFNPGITINHFYSFKPSLSHRHRAFKKFNTHRSHLNEWPMTINGKNTPILDVLLLLHLAGSQPMLKSSYKAKASVIISIPSLVGGVADVVVEIKGTVMESRDKMDAGVKNGAKPLKLILKKTIFMPPTSSSESPVSMPKGVEENASGGVKHDASRINNTSRNIGARGSLSVG
nr:hypothetical protein [Tanacetum cinerariifolium]